MMITLRALLILLFVSTLAACSAIGPTSSPEFPQLIAKAVPPEDGEVRFSGSGIWFPNVRGFTDVRSSLLGGQVVPTPGVLVVTDTAILFQQWDSKTEQFDVIKRLPLADVMSVALDTYGVNRRLVVRKKDLSFDTFSFTQAAGNFIDKEKTENSFQFLDARIGKKTAEQPPTTKP
jgi:hypothetical protein